MEKSIGFDWKSCMCDVLKLNEVDIAGYSPLTLAYIGDSVYEQYVRNYLVTHTKYKPHKLHIEATKYVKASAQAELLKSIERDLTEKEKDIVRRTRNTRKSSFA